MSSIKDVKQFSILEVAARLGYPFKRVSGQIYEHPNHDSFRIFADTNTFKWFSRDKQGDVIDFVQLVADVSFKEALSFLKTGDFKPIKPLEFSFQPFHYYLPESPFEEARSYLKQVRGLTNQTINAFGNQRLLVQAIYHTKDKQEPVLVFKSYEHQGNLQGASLQGIVADDQKYEKGHLKKIMKGSHGYVGLSFDLGKPNRLIFCESVIDMMSYYQLHHHNLSDVRLIAMEGLKESVIAYQTLRLVAEEQGKPEFLKTLNLQRLSHYLQALQETTTYFKNHTDLITLAVDNDPAGKAFCQKLQDKDLPVKVDLPRLQGDKPKVDWNDVVSSIREPHLTQLIQATPSGATNPSTPSYTIDL